MGELASIALSFALLSILSFGGINAILPEMQRTAVVTHGWMSEHTFLQLFTIAQAAPGPNMLIATLVGWQAGGLAGAIVATVAICAPTCLLIFVLDAYWSRWRQTRPGRAFAAAVAPAAAGLVLSGGYLVGRSQDPRWTSIALTVATVVIAMRWRRNPLWLIGTGALLGLVGLV